MDGSEVLKQVEQYVKDIFGEDCTGHDFYHMKRVAKMAVKLAHEEEGDPFIAEAAGWLHDVWDKKLAEDSEKAEADLKTFMNSLAIDPDDKADIWRAMEGVSFQSGHQIPTTLEGKIVQDADRLDALGAIGIARTFAFGGARGQMIHMEDDSLTSIRHFYDKLFKLKDLMNTQTARQIAEDRHRLMEEFVEEFYDEWNLDV